MSPRFLFTNQNNMDKVVKHGNTMSMFIYFLPITIFKHHGCSFINLNWMYSFKGAITQLYLQEHFSCTTIRAAILSILLILYNYDNVQNIKLRSNIVNGHFIRDKFCLLGQKQQRRWGSMKDSWLEQRIENSRGKILVVKFK